MSATQGWWNDFFSGLAVDFWRQAVPPELTEAEAVFLARHLGVGPSSRLLDVPCGDGRLAIELSARGFRLAAVDISTQFLEHAGRESSSRGLDIEWRHADMRDLPPFCDFDGAFCFGNSFGYFGDAGDLEFLNSVHDSLRPGARFAIDVHMIAEVLFPQFETEFDYEAGDIQLLLSNRYEPTEGCVYTDYTFTRGDTIERRSNVHRVYTCRQVLEMLAEAGFADPVIFGGLEGEPFVIGSSRLVVVVTRT